MTELLPTVIVAVAAFVLFHKQANAHIEAIRALNAEHKAERAELLTRIQAPDVATTLTSAEPTGELLHVPYDDDAAHDEYMEQREQGLVR